MGGGDISFSLENISSLKMFTPDDILKMYMKIFEDQNFSGKICGFQICAIYFSLLFHLSDVLI